MGLYIYGKHTDKECHWGYSMLHLIRDVALMTCGVNKEFARATRAHWEKEGYTLEHYIKSYCPSFKIAPIDLYGLRLAGYYYPNLLFHSDCGGTYTKYGKVMQDAHLLTGSLKGLKEELELIKHDLEKDKYEISDCQENAINQLLELVTDELNFKRPIIYFS